MSREALKLALEALEEINKLSIGENAICLPAEIDTAMDAIREALAEQHEMTNIERHERNVQKFLAEQPAQQEPVARQYQNRDGVWKDFISEKHYKDTLEDGSWPIRNLYKSPPAQRTWVGLTDEERGQAINANFGTGLWAMAKDIEAKLKEKNT